MSRSPDVVRRLSLLLLIWARCVAPVHAEVPVEIPAAAPQVVPVVEEPLHIVRYESERFLIYTNWIEPGIRTLYHAHRNDLLATLANSATVSGQVPGEETVVQEAPAGASLFFPYADLPAPFVHRVGATGESPFVNVGLEFLGPVREECAETSVGWTVDAVRALETNRRGTAYRLTVAPGAQLALPSTGTALLLVPLNDGRVLLDAGFWDAVIGDFRFFEGRRPALLRNPGNRALHLSVFVAC